MREIGVKRKTVQAIVPAVLIRANVLRRPGLQNLNGRNAGGEKLINIDDGPLLVLNHGRYCLQALLSRPGPPTGRVYPLSGRGTRQIGLGEPEA